MRTAMIVDGRTLFVEAIPDSDKFRVLTPGHVEIGQIDAEALHRPGYTQKVLQYLLHEYLTRPSPFEPPSIGFVALALVQEHDASEHHLHSSIHGDA